MLKLPTAVFVPFEWDKHLKQWVPLHTIPRFLEPVECVRYFQTHPETNGRFIDFQEHSEPEFIREYTQGVGTDRWLSEQRK